MIDLVANSVRWVRVREGERRQRALHSVGSDALVALACCAWAQVQINNDNRDTDDIVVLHLLLRGSPQGYPRASLKSELKVFYSALVGMERQERRSVLDGQRAVVERKALAMRWLGCAGGALLAVTLIGAAVALGLLLPPHADSLPHAAHNTSGSGGDPPPYAQISAVVGWLYFIAWSVSFWPQVFLNCRRRSVEGLSLDFELYNMLGFTCYSAYNAAMLWSPSIIAAYQAQHGGSAPTVRVNDFVFSTHAMAVTALTLVQCVIYPHKRGRISFLGYILLLGALAALALYALLVWLVRLEAFNWLNFLDFVSYVKIGVTVIKYVPQVILNCRRGSTQGWSVWNVWLDFSGGALSLAQQVMDSATTGRWGGFAGDLAKTCLGVLSIVFDAVFLAQHYVCLNRHRGCPPSINANGSGGGGSGGGGDGAQYFDDLNLGGLRYSELSDPTSTPGGVSCLLCTVTFRANHAHNLTRSP